MKSTHKAEVVKIELLPHENSDNLSIVKIYGYTVCVRTADWIDKDKGVYIVPDSLVSTLRPEFTFLGSDKPYSSDPADHIKRIKVCKLRGVLSQGLLVPCPEGFEIGDDCAEYFGIQRYEEVIESEEDVNGPALYAPKYDVDSFHRYLDLFKDGEVVSITEKLNGQNARYVFHNGEIYCGSRTRWKKQTSNSAWWQALTPEMKKWLEQWPDYILYGEIYGKVGKFPYDSPSKWSFRAFDILQPNAVYLNPDEFFDVCSWNNITHVPIISFMEELDKKKVLEYAEGKSLIGDHIREGCVIKPMEERQSDEIGRVFMKVVGDGYYSLK